jgi:hypothetical protein
MERQQREAEELRKQEEAKREAEERRQAEIKRKEEVGAIVWSDGGVSWPEILYG